MVVTIKMYLVAEDDGVYLPCMDEAASGSGFVHLTEVDVTVPVAVSCITRCLDSSTQNPSLQCWDTLLLQWFCQ